MKSFTLLAAQAKHILNDNAPAILTAFGVVGTVGATVLSAKASFEAAQKIRDAEFAKKQTEGFENGGLTKADKFKLVWPLYIPAGTTCALSVGSIIMSHRISSRRAAVLAAAYALNQDKLEEYQDKVKEKFGVKKEKEARDEIAQAKVNSAGDAGFYFANPLAGKQWMMEAYTGRPFLSTVEDVNRAVNEVNATIQRERSVRLSDFYDLIGLEHVSLSDYFGFTENEPLEIDWSTTTSPDGNLAVMVFEYVNHPVMNPEREATFR
jgi:hypothetical protein